MSPETQRASRVPAWLIYVVVGLAAGLMSGLFGVGGGTVIVPLLVLLAAFDQRLASGTSLAAIVPTAIVGVISYAAMGEVSWVAAALLAAGAVVGAQIGTWLLPRLPLPWLRWGFIGFLGVVIVNLFLVVPSRDAELIVTWLSGGGLLFAGLITGVLSGLLGVGGGIVVVPVLILAFGANDLVAKGTSLLMMIPTAISGTLGNLKRRNVDLRAAAFIGLGACLSTAAGAQLAQYLDPAVATPLFAVFLAFIAVQLILKALKAGKAAKG
ncbi:MAG: sulfite exporter TauE/SafE family protein [Tessaracoccus sp.]|uniref:sulfite exporter TauE/SafE family protein n=1 Tax=Tessaracoccus sp. TaxID=1971211 RepID=UPI001ED3B6C8|nr:sulfite exporter TauE/SafE family protein [Tessaracoccus sp.]MBK7819717.1 sulfite exporter TauE/SafE family protein [Tessaracoccus sp.]